MSRYGFDDLAWDSAKAQAKDVIVLYAKKCDMIAYSELVRHITSIQIEAHDPRLGQLLGEISTEVSVHGGVSRPGRVSQSISAILMNH